MEKMLLSDNILALDETLIQYSSDEKNVMIPSKYSGIFLKTVGAGAILAQNAEEITLARGYTCLNNEPISCERGFVLNLPDTLIKVNTPFKHLGRRESPRWLASKGRHEEAQAIIDEFIGEGYVLEEEPLTEKLGVKALFNRKTIRSLAFVCIFWSLNVIPYFGVYTFLPILLQEFGFPETQLVDIALNVVLLASFSLRNARAEYCPFPRLPSAAHALWCSPFFQKGQR